jgi:hypothetical protein
VNWVCARVTVAGSLARCNWCGYDSPSLNFGFGARCTFADHVVTCRSRAATTAWNGLCSSTQWRPCCVTVAVSRTQTPFLDCTLLPARFDCGLLRLWVAPIVVCSDCGLLRLRFAPIVGCSDCGLLRLRFAPIAVCSDCGLLRLWVGPIVVCSDCNLFRLWVAPIAICFMTACLIMVRSASFNCQHFLFDHTVVQC